MVAEAIDITRETYFCILMDRESNGPVLVASPDGGVDIEEVAEKTPGDAIFFYSKIFSHLLYLFFRDNSTSFHATLGEH